MVLIKQRVGRGAGKTAQMADGLSSRLCPPSAARTAPAAGVGGTKHAPRRLQSDRVLTLRRCTTALASHALLHKCLLKALVTSAWCTPMRAQSAAPGPACGSGMSASAASIRAGTSVRRSTAGGPPLLCGCSCGAMRLQPCRPRERQTGLADAPKRSQNICRDSYGCSRRITPFLVSKVRLFATDQPRTWINKQPSLQSCLGG